MGIQVELRLADERVRALPDPAGGSFDAAGDFDRLLRSGRTGLPLLGGVDPHGELRLGPGDMAQLVDEIDLLLEEATAGPEQRGLMRLRTMAARCAQEVYGQLVFSGD
ncbi:hypothetical protein AB0K00_53310 [Dactylosporangium sp. NPDC049525]|uniref:hypothetical protein n=1 Tax=Dactylosporangium sp. NPDC049525 TaxID=3154730 RepID=UPI0034132395